MINRAKCKKCLSIIESHLPDEIVPCKCGAIAVCDGPAMRMLPVGSGDFVRVDDMGNEILVKYVAREKSNTEEEKPDAEQHNVSVQESLKALESSIEYNERLPDHVKYSPATNAEVNVYLRSILNILKQMNDRSQSACA